MFGGNLITIVLFAVEERLRKKSLFLVINMAFVGYDVWGCVAAFVRLLHLYGGRQLPFVKTT